MQTNNLEQQNWKPSAEHKKTNLAYLYQQEENKTAKARFWILHSTANPDFHAIFLKN